ncbi:kelch domain-containing protein 8A-like isoform X1 [Octopus sinensis]|uniref:Kelch domain-containing protein 8A-like isoform X1 n=1 Tax=Octopus sinensis TaxID=2607531 RepID=A0A6P7U074_9MOLL|nr:kelch domain-containing protein 8A-like isoform X1 [Octopus sinensis]
MMKNEAEDTKEEDILYLFDKSGSGDVHYMTLNNDIDQIAYKPLNTVRWEQTSNVVNFEIAVVNNVLYIIGGYRKNAAICTGRLLCYNPKDGTWRKRTPMPTPRMRFSACVKDNVIYVVGGEKTGGCPTDCFEIYNTQTDVWKAGSRLPSPRVWISCTLLSEKSLFAAGGTLKGKGRNNFWIYECSQWQELDNHCPQTLPKCLDRMVMASVDDTIYFIGGVTTEKDRGKKVCMYTNPRVFAFKPHVSLGSYGSPDLICPWDLDLPSPQYPRCNATHLKLGCKIYLFGGSDFETETAVTQVESFDTQTKRWAKEFQIDKKNISDISCAVLTGPTDILYHKNLYKWLPAMIPHRYILW